MANHKTVTGTLGSAVANDGTFTVSYPAKTAPESGTTDAGDFYQGVWHKLVMNQASLVAPDDFTLTFGTSSITVTNKSGASWPAGAEYTLQIEEPGKKVYADTDGTGSRMAAMTRSDAFLINLGAPDTADADGYFASQNLTTAGVASVSTTVAAAIAAAALAGTADVPRNVVAAWTGTAVLTVTGTDAYGNTIVESSASGTSFTGTKAFKTVTGISVSANVTSLTVGTGNVIGLPVYLPGRQHVLAEIIDGTLCGDRQPIRIPFQISQTDLLAGTEQFLVAPATGRVMRVSTIVQTAFGLTDPGDLGTVHVTVNGNAVTGSTLTSYTTRGTTGGAAGDVASTLIPTTSDNAAVTAGQKIGIKPSSTWSSVGALNGTLEIAPTGSGIYKSGTFVVGDTTGGGATATTGDVRGTYTPPVTPDGSIVFQLLVTLPNPGQKGTSQYAG